MGTKPAEKKSEIKKPATKEKVATKEAKTETPKATKAASAAGAKGAKKVKKAAPAPEPMGTKPKRCRIKSCKKEYRAKGYCQSHYKKWRRGEYGLARYKICKDGDCRQPMAMNRHGYCEEHFQNYYVKGIEVQKVAAPAKPDVKPVTAAEKAAG